MVFVALHFLFLFFSFFQKVFWMDSWTDDYLLICSLVLQPGWRQTRNYTCVCGLTVIICASQKLNYNFCVLKGIRSQQGLHSQAISSNQYHQPISRQIKVLHIEKFSFRAKLHEDLSFLFFYSSIFHTFFNQCQVGLMHVLVHTCRC